MPKTEKKTGTRPPNKFCLPSAAILTAGLALLIDGGTSSASLLLATAILITAAMWTFRKNFTPSLPGIALALFFAMAFLTTLPMPDIILRAAGSEAASHHVLARSALRETAEAGFTSEAGFFQISRNRAGTMRAILLLTVMLSCGALARKLNPERKLQLLLALGCAASIIAALGLVSIHIHPQEKTFWWLLPVSHGRPVACFVNRNHFGGFTAVVATVMLGLSCRFFSTRRNLAITCAVFFIICAAGAIGSLSRGAVLSLTFGILLAAVINARRHPLSLAVLIAILCAGIVFTFSHKSRGETLRARFSSLASPTRTTSGKMRIATWKSSIKIIKHYPLLGTGLNAFRAVFPQHRNSSNRKEPDNVENEFIQIPVETGFPGSALLLASLLLFLMPAAGAEGRTFLLPAVLPGLAVVAAHGFVDFAIRIPLYGLTTAFLAGLCISTAHLSKSRNMRRLTLACVLPAALIVFIFSCISPEKTFQLDSYDYLNSASPAEITTAIESSPSSWHAYYNLGRLAASNPKLRELAEKNITRASNLDPLNYRLLIQLARLRMDMGKIDSAIEAYKKAKALRSWLNVRELEILINLPSEQRSKRH